MNNATNETSRSLAVLALPRRIDAFIAYAVDVVRAMTVNPSFPSPAPALATVLAAVSDLRAAESLVRARHPGDGALSICGRGLDVATAGIPSMPRVHSDGAAPPRQHDHHDAGPARGHRVRRRLDDRGAGHDRVCRPGGTELATRSQVAASSHRSLDASPGSRMRLRDVIEADLPALFEQQRDPLAVAMAHFPPRQWDAFLIHWRTRIMNSPTSTARIIDVDGEVAGYVASWQLAEGPREVGYCLGRAYWGKGIATQALRTFLSQHEARRPLAAVVSADNVASRRVLEKCGFEAVGEPALAADGVVEVTLRLGA